jgi:hypothetical protein
VQRPEVIGNRLRIWFGFWLRIRFRFRVWLRFRLGLRFRLRLRFRFRYRPVHHRCNRAGS